jgi:hypothetical protein
MPSYVDRESEKEKRAEQERRYEQYRSHYGVIFASVS